MFSSYSEQFLSVAKSNLESQLASFNALHKSAFTSVEKVLALNIATVKSSAEESLAVTRQLLSVSAPEEFFSLTAARKPDTEKLASYGRHLNDILSATRTEFAQEAETLFADTNTKVKSLFDEAAKNAPAAAESAVSMLKVIITNTNAGYEQLSKNTKQAVETLETQVATVAVAAEKALSETVAQ